MNKQTKIPRNALIKILRHQDAPLAVIRIAEIFQISRQRVYVILKEVSK